MDPGDDQIIAALSVPPPEFPAAALRAAEEAGGRLTDALIDVVCQTHRVALEGRDPEGNAHIFAMLLLARIEEPRAFEAISEFFTLPEDVLDSLVGDFLTEDLGRVLASVCGGRMEPLSAIVEDFSRGEYVRSAALSAIIALVQRQLITREQAAAYLRALMHGGLEEVPSAVWDELASVVRDLYVEDLFEDIRGAICSGLIGHYVMTERDVDRTEREGVVAAMARLNRNTHLQPVRDVVAETSWWACFQDDEARLDQPAEMDVAACDDPDCMEYGHTRVPVLRGGPKIGRNDPCPCGSGKKYKKCCLE
jgi:hypothetical protein